MTEGEDSVQPVSSHEGDINPPRLSDETRWYTEHAALFISTLKWALLGGIAGICVGLGTRAFLWSLTAGTALAHRLDTGWFHFYFLLPLALPACVWLIRTFAPTAKGHGTEAVITAVHQNWGRVDWIVAPIKLLATILTLAFGGSVGKEGPCAQIGAAITSLFADVLRLSDPDRRRLVICGIGAGFAAVFGTPISGAIFGIEVLYLGRIEYGVLFPCMVAGIVSHLVCGVRAPVPAIAPSFGGLSQPELVLLSLAFGAVFGLMALVLIETMRGLERMLRRFEDHPYVVAVCGGIVLALIYAITGTRYAGLGTDTIEVALAGVAVIPLGGFPNKDPCYFHHIGNRRQWRDCHPAVLHRGDGWRSLRPSGPSAGKRVRGIRFRGGGRSGSQHAARCRGHGNGTTAWPSWRVRSVVRVLRLPDHGPP